MSGICITVLGSVSSHGQEIKRAKANVCVFADSVLCVGQMKDSPETIEKWKGQVEGLRLYSSYQDALGIDGEAIEFEWKHKFILMPQAMKIPDAKAAVDKDEVILEAQRKKR